jgi:PAS domain S-box-containing protein
LIAVIGRNRLADPPLAEATLKMVAVRAAGEMDRLDAESALRQSEECYRSLFNNMTDSFAVGDLIFDEQGVPGDCRFLDINPAFEKMTGLEREKVSGRLASEVFPGDGPQWMRTSGAAALASDSTHHCRYSAAGGRHFEMSAYQPSPRQLAVVVRDVTEQERVAEEQRERAKELACLYGIADVIAGENRLEDILQRTVELMPGGWVHVDVACSRIVLNGREFRTVGFRETPWRQVSAIVLHGKPIGTVELDYLEERPHKGEGPFLIEERRLINAIAERLGRVLERRDAQDRLEKARTDAVMESRRLEVLAGALADSEAALKKANDELASANEALQRSNATLEARVAQRTAQLAQRTTQLQALAKDLTRAEERERQRIAQVIHDHLQQLLSVARINTGMALEKARRLSLRADLREVDSLIAKSLELTRSLTADLSPDILRRSGLTPALRWLGRWYRERFALNVTVVAEEDAAIEEDVRTTLFRSVRELLFNVVKHAQVTSARVVVGPVADGRLSIVVSDDGVGFDADAVRPWEGTGGSFGLFSMRERLVLLGGQLHVRSAPGRGTSVTILSPPSAKAVPGASAAAASSTGRPAVAVRKRGGGDRRQARAGRR